MTFVVELHNLVTGERADVGELHVCGTDVSIAAEVTRLDSITREVLRGFPAVVQRLVRAGRRADTYNSAHCSIRLRALIEPGVLPTT